MDDDCEDQGMMPTETCNAFGCNRAHLVLRGQFWCCPQCGVSYAPIIRTTINRATSATGARKTSPTTQPSRSVDEVRDDA